MHWNNTLARLGLPIVLGAASVPLLLRAAGPATAPSSATAGAEALAPISLNDAAALVPTEYRHKLIQQLSLAEKNQQQWLETIRRAKPEHRTALAFLLVNMPDADLKSLTGDYVLRHVELAYQARGESAWAAAVPEEIFFNDVVAYANLNERRDDWRADFRTRFVPLVKDCKTPGEAAQILNREVFKAVDVKYHATKRKKPDQSPYESIEYKFASCSGLSILLVDACRAVGVPARVAGTPLWTDKSGNHTWVEVWDGQWRFIGAAEPGEFDRTWFGGNASKADPNKPEHRIYAASFRRTKLPFPMIWDLRNAEHGSVDVTPYYIARQKMKITMPAGIDTASIEVRQDDRLIARAAGNEANFELSVGVPYSVRGVGKDGVATAERVVTLKREAADAVTLERSTSAPLTQCPIPGPTSAEDLAAQGDWAKMKGMTPRGYVAHRAAKPITIDGRPDDAAWGTVPWTQDFIDIEGPRKAAPRFWTRMKMMWDDQYLYLLAELEEPHVWGTITKKKEVIFNDNDFEVFIDPDGDSHNYYEFEVNALNTIWELGLDKPYRDGGNVKNGANIEGLKSAVHVNGTINNPTDTDRGWTVEIAIPWKGLAPYAGKKACPPVDGDQWRANFSRVEWLIDIIDGKYRKVPKEARPEDNWIWSQQGVVDMHRPERWGYVQFATGEPGKTAFVPDATAPARDALAEIYYRQNEFKKRTGRFAVSTEDLGLSAQALANIPASIGINKTSKGYTATAKSKASPGGSPVLQMNEDSKVTAGKE